MEGSQRLRIIQLASELFNSRGYKAVTVSDLSERLGISKKTIYQYFIGKEEIAQAVIKDVQSHIEETIKVSTNQGEDPLQILQDTLNQIKNQVTSFGPLFLEDIKKYLPDLWQNIEQFRTEKMCFVEQLLKRAKDLGMIKEIDPHLATVIFQESVQALIQPDSLARHGYPMVEVMDALIRVFCNGVIDHSYINQ